MLWSMQTCLVVSALLLLTPFASASGFPDVIDLETPGSVEVWVRADSTMDGHVGFLVEQIVDSQPEETQFQFIENDYVRAYARKGAWQDTFFVYPEVNYLVKTHTMAIGDSWNSWWEPTFAGGPTTVTVVDTQTVTVFAGTFFCYVTEHRRDETLLEELWWSENVGPVRVRLNDPPDFLEGNLESFEIYGGDGFSPLAIENRWRFTVGPVPVETMTWGSVKALYRR